MQSYVTSWHRLTRSHNNCAGHTVSLKTRLNQLRLSLLIRAHIDLAVLDTRVTGKVKDAFHRGA